MREEKVFLTKMTRDLCHELYRSWENDDVKGKGFGTEAERLTIQYAFEELGMLAVNADTVVKNVGSQHILDKLGFEFVKEEGDFRYYRIERCLERFNL